MNLEMKRQVRFIALFFLVWQVGGGFVADVAEFWGRMTPEEPLYGLQFVFNDYNIGSNYVAPIAVFAFLWLITRHPHSS